MSITNRALKKTAEVTGIKDSFSGVSQQLEEVASFSNQSKNSTATYMGNNTILTRLYNGSLVYVDSRDISLTPHLVMGGEWEMEITRVFLRFLKEDSIVVDVGANFGFFALVAGSVCKAGTVIAVEANPAISDLLYKSFLVNGMGHPNEVVNLAVSNKASGSIELNVAPTMLGGSTIVDLESKLPNGPKHHRETVEVELSTLDKVAKERDISSVDVMKIDIEGAEPEAYEGASEIIKRSANLCLFLEFTSYIYDEPEHFFDRINADFDSVFMIRDGALHKVESAGQVMSAAKRDGWVMCVACKGSSVEIAQEILNAAG